MTKPGEWLRAKAARLCSRNTMERLVDPIVADLQKEYGESVTSGRRWRARAILVIGYVGFAKALLLHGRQAMLATRECSADDRRALGRAFPIAAMTAAVVIVLLEIPPLLKIVQNASRLRAASVFYLIPQTLPFAIPVGIALGILLGLRHKATGRRVTAAIVLVSIVSSAASLAALNWIIPASNQAFRRAIFEDRPGWKVGRGVNELTLAELRMQMRGERVPDFGFSIDPRVAGVTYHFRWASSVAAVPFAVFALSLVRRRSLKRWVAIICGVGAAAGYYAILDIGVGFARDGTLPPVAGAWLANMVLLLVATAFALGVTTETTPDQGGALTTS